MEIVGFYEDVGSPSPVRTFRASRQVRCQCRKYCRWHGAFRLELLPEHLCQQGKARVCSNYDVKLAELSNPYQKDGLHFAAARGIDGALESNLELVSRACAD